ncbi:MAG: Fe-S cluster assembly scaffold protein NifU [Candidatus Thorarchaeota archaeon]
MKSTQYSEKVLDHFRNPRNVGVLEGDDVAVGRVGNPVCGDLMEVFIRVKDDRIVDAKFRTFGCGSAIASSSMTTELVKGMTLDEAMKVTREDVATELDGLPPIKMHCSNLAADALHEAIMNYRRAHGQAGSADSVSEVTTPRCIVGKEQYLGKGVYTSVDDVKAFSGKRVMVLHTGDQSLMAALEIANETSRVIIVTPESEIHTSEEIGARLEDPRIKIIYESRLAEIRGEDEVERVLIHDENEDEDHEIFVDAVVIIE